MKQLLTLMVLSSLLLAACGNPPTSPVEAEVTAPEVESSVPLTTLTPTSAPPTATPPEPPTGTSPPPTPTPAGPPPAPGTGNVIGRILWNGQPVSDLETKLCEEVSLVRGCSGLEFGTSTDETGTYLFTDITPGDYGVVAHALDADRWLYVTAGLGPGARKYSVAPDEILYVGDQHIFKSDLKHMTPDEADQVDMATPTLSWEPYADAVYYELYLAPENGDALLVSHRADDSQIALDSGLLNCRYTWKVEAFNAQEVKIAESDGYSHFSVTGQPASCYVGIIAPVGDAEVSGSGLNLSWEPHPLAAFYKIQMWNDTESGRPKVLDFVEVREPNYAFSETLAPARYVWSVYAYAETGVQIAGSGVHNFEVAGP
jgi:hypothetical protein